MDLLRRPHPAAAGAPEPGALAQEIASTLGELETGLLSLIQNGAEGALGLDEIHQGLSEIVHGLGGQYVELQETLERRDLAFDVVGKFEALRGELLWLYRKAKLERYFFARLRLERRLRDAVHRQIIETYQEMSELEEAERDLRASPEEALAAALLREPGEDPPVTDQG